MKKRPTVETRLSPLVLLMQAKVTKYIWANKKVELNPTWNGVFAWSRSGVKRLAISPLPHGAKIVIIETFWLQYVYQNDSYCLYLFFLVLVGVSPLIRLLGRTSIQQTAHNDPRARYYSIGAVLVWFLVDMFECLQVQIPSLLERAGIMVTRISTAPGGSSQPPRSQLHPLTAIEDGNLCMVWYR